MTDQQQHPITPPLDLEQQKSPCIVFMVSPTKEIARFTKEGFYYKGEFVDDAGEVHRLLKDVLNGICYKQLCIEMLEELKHWTAYEDRSDALVDRAIAALNPIATELKGQ